MHYGYLDANVSCKIDSGIQSRAFQARNGSRNAQPLVAPKEKEATSVVPGPVVVCDKSLFV